ALRHPDRHEKLDYVATIHHGIDMQEFQVGSGPGDYLLFFGRIHHEKGTVEAIEVAEQTGMPLIIGGIIQDHDYFERFVEPRVDGERVRYVGPVGSDLRGDLLGGARALLHMINFDEPFGFSVVEAMACGTPVITRSRGSMSEIVRDGENGYLVDSLDAAVEAVHAVAGMDRMVVRASVEGRFDSKRMVDEYLAVYHLVVKLDRDQTDREGPCPLIRDR
ncbi:MAG: glycosyltransferase, partial [Gemmatimonadetes bacterium]|nr:glycosyltransferase [Gemmatimonadota bacterium]